MFISEAEANKRLRSSKNVLTVIDKDGDSTDGEEHLRDPQAIEPDEPPDVLVPTAGLEDEKCASARGIMSYPDEALLKKMLNPEPTKLGRRKGQMDLSREVQAAIATTAQIVNGRVAANEFGVSYHHADELKHGFTCEEARYGYEGRKQEPHAELEKIINQQKKQVRDLAFEKLTKALGLISDDKLKVITDATKLSRIAKDLSGVVEKVLPKETSNLGGVHFHVFRPDMRPEDTYDIINVGGPR